MTPDDFQRVKEIFSRVIRLQPEDRESFLHHVCGDDSTTYREVRSLLKHHHQDKTVIDQPDEGELDGETKSPSKVEPYLVRADTWKESRDLLHRRLTIVATVLAIISAASMIRLIHYNNPALGYGVRLFSTFIGLMVAWQLHRSREISFRWLRIAELVIVANIALFELVLYFRSIPYFAALGKVETVISFNSWHYLAWTMLIIVYGMFMPNTWKRAASILVPLSLVPLAAAVLLRSIDPQFAQILDRDEGGQPFLAPIAAAGIAIYAARKLQDARAMASEARRLGQYRLTRLIGDGGMGKVYEAEHLLLKRACAVKYIRPDRSDDARLLRRFEREVRATAKLTHPHTIEVYDYGQTKEGLFYFAMEYLPGMNLQQLVRSSGPLPPGRAVHFLVQVCDALTEAHGARLIHRDIKPANIFASQRGGIYDFTKLLDFGVVRESEPSMSLSGKMVAGTPSYMSPEQATRPEAIDARSDLYSVGSVGYFLLCGRPPFVASSPMQVMQAVVEQTPEPLSVHRPDVPADLEAVLMRCLAKDPDDRFPSARILCEELQKCQSAGDWTRADAETWWQTQDSIVTSQNQAGSNTRVAEDTETPLRTSLD